MSDQRFWHAGQTARTSERSRSAYPASDYDANIWTLAGVAANKKVKGALPVCCTGDCRQGRDCPLRPRRARIAPAYLIAALVLLVLVLMALTR